MNERFLKKMYTRFYSLMFRKTTLMRRDRRREKVRIERIRTHEHFNAVFIFEASQVGH